ncbi:hypothetical protein FOZ62_028388 [Perkinsus olseni]|uniref:AB hydrolase-1 domain-containing protein n=1 Tax=Perkinsus olseni TaxID=32597 RepID=A0A7J6U0U2_PEROL|nr:hypothetical protein FOZ62_028388 [Perkinsus olseni]
MDTSLKVPTVCMDGSPGRGWRRILLWGSLASISAILLIRQQLLPRVLYYRRRYSEEIEYYKMITTRFAAYHEMPYSITWRGEEYAQVAYMIPSVASRPPSGALWLLLGGNAMLAKDWLPFVHSVRHSDSTGELDRATFLLVDYPGYGESQGPSLNPDSINAVVHAAVEALLTRQPREFDSIHTLGHSLGGAVALRFARERIAKDYLRVRSVITSSTFTSIAAMIRSIVGLPLSLSKLLAVQEQ